MLFRTPDGDGELCWYSYYSPGGDVSEPWPELVARSWQDSRQKWRELFEDPELVEEGRKAFRLLQATEASNLLPREVLWFIIYFIPSGSEEREERLPGRRVAPGSMAEEMEMGLCPAE